MLSNYFLEINEHEHEFRSRIKECTLCEFEVLLYLQHAPHSRMTDIAKKRKVSLESVWKLCNRLKLRGLIKEKPNERDKRSTLLSLTRQGESLTNKCSKQMEAIINGANKLV